MRGLPKRIRVPRTQRSPRSPSNLEQIGIDAREDLVQSIQEPVLEGLSSGICDYNPVLGNNCIGVSGLDKAAGSQLIEGLRGKRPFLGIELDLQSKLELAALGRPTDQVDLVKRPRGRSLRSSQESHLEAMHAHSLHRIPLGQRDLPPYLETAGSSVTLLGPSVLGQRTRAAPASARAGCEANTRWCFSIQKRNMNASKVGPQRRNSCTSIMSSSVSPSALMVCLGVRLPEEKDGRVMAEWVDDRIRRLAC